MAKSPKVRWRKTMMAIQQLEKIVVSRRKERSTVINATKRLSKSRQEN